MRIALIAVSGPAKGRRLVLRGGQIAHIGRTDGADFSVPEDTQLADIHFSVECGMDAAKLRTSAPSLETRVNGVPTAASEVKHGDKVEAGSSVFYVEVEGYVHPTTPVQADVTNETKTPQTDEQHVLNVAKYLGLSEAAIVLASNQKNADTFASRLIENKLIQDALRWTSYMLPKPQAVKWACACTAEIANQEQDEKQISAYQSASNWANAPEELKRVSALAQAENCKFEGVGGILAAAAGLSGGSLAPPDQLPVPPDDRLTAKSIETAIVVAMSTGPSVDYEARLLKALARASEFSSSPPQG